MKRSVRLAAGAGLAAAAWAAALRLALPWPARGLVLAAPLLAAAALGAYMLALLVYGVLTFRSCPEEAAALHEDIRRARAALAAKGFVFAADGGAAVPGDGRAHAD
ncbi:Dpm3 [Scenedesmus sp. PABB004]|nr:Dpm3 [Scenedesmus sp. PABB004]